MFTLLLFSRCSGDQAGESCLIEEVLAGYPESFDFPYDNIDYYMRIEFDHDGAGRILEIREYLIEEDRLLRTTTDFSSAAESFLPENASDGRYYYPTSDTVFQSFIEMQSGNATLEGITRLNNQGQESVTGRNFFDSYPNVFKQRPEFRYLAVGRQSIAGLNSENNLIGWADLVNGNLAQTYLYVFDLQGNLVRTQVPSGLTLDFTYTCQ